MRLGPPRATTFSASIPPGRSTLNVAQSAETEINDAGGALSARDGSLLSTSMNMKSYLPPGLFCAPAAPAAQAAEIVGGAGGKVEDSLVASGDNDTVPIADATSCTADKELM